ncbi:hypothetical protein EC991_004559, partial [Linnemannia zychae]
QAGDSDGRAGQSGRKRETAGGGHTGKERGCKRINQATVTKRKVSTIKGDDHGEGTQGEGSNCSPTSTKDVSL